MSTQQPPRLSRDQIRALRFAANRQIARWSGKRDLSPQQQTQRTALTSAVRILEDRTLAGGCELRAPIEHDDA